MNLEKIAKENFSVFIQQMQSKCVFVIINIEKIMEVNCCNEKAFVVGWICKDKSIRWAKSSNI